jgi:hypothetical protein
LQDTVIVFPCIMFCMGVTIKFGIDLANKFGSFWVLIVLEILATVTVFTSSYMPTFMGIYLFYLGFVLIFGLIFCLLVGMTFQIPMI